MRAERHELQAPTWWGGTGRGWGEGQDQLGSRKAVGVAWRQRGSTCTAMGLVWPQEPVEKGLGRLFREQCVVRARTRSRSGWGNRKSKDLGSQHQDEGCKASQGHVLSRRICVARGPWGGMGTGWAGGRVGVITPRAWATLSLQPQAAELSGCELNLISR